MEEEKDKIYNQDLLLEDKTFFKKNIIIFIS